MGVTAILDFILAGFAASLVVHTIVRWKVGLTTISEVVAQQQRIRKVAAAGTHAPSIRIVLLLPLLREQAEVERLLCTMDSFDFPPDRVVLVPITTEREIGEQQERRAAGEAFLRDVKAGSRGLRLQWRYSRFFPAEVLRQWLREYKASPTLVETSIRELLEQPTTREVVENVLSRHSFRCRVVPLHCPTIEGNKATQMNFALADRKLKSFLDRRGRTYVGVFDADSAPSGSTLLALSMAADANPAPAYQQYPIYLRDADRLGRLMRIEAVLQTARSVCVEYPRQMAVNAVIAAGSAFGRTFTYCIGHGEFLRADWLAKVGFPESTPVDDLPTGFMLSLACQRIEPLPIFDWCTVPRSTLDFIRQTESWFAAQLDTKVPYCAAIQYFGKVPKRRYIRGVVEKAAANFTWAISGPVRVLSVLAGGLVGAWWGIGLLVAAFLLEARAQWAVADRLLRIAGEDAPRGAPKFDWAAVARPVIKSCGPCLYLLRSALRLSRPRYKTERG